MSTLLATNAKLLKHNGEHYLLTGLALAPHGIGGHNVCSASTLECRAACVLWFTGRTVTQSVRSAMIERKRLLVDDPVGFYDQLHCEIERHKRRALKLGIKPAIRLNVASDLDWSEVARAHADCQFYDYTKVISRLSRADWPANYQLTYSVSERSDLAAVDALLGAGRNVAAVFSTRYWPQGGRIDALPASWRFRRKLWPIVDGDAFDLRLRELDGSGVIVGLRFKGSLKRRARAIRNGFCLNVGDN